jgi:methyl-accepting chemotaxis protein
MDNGKFIGVSNCDVELSSMADLEYSNGGYNSAYVTVNDSNKTYLANTGDPATVGQTADFPDDTIEAVTGGEKIINSVKDNIGGKQSFAIFVPVKITGTDINWVLTSIVHKDEVRASVYQSLMIVAVIGIIGVVALVLISSFIVNKSLAPVKPLMKIAENVGQFNLSEVDDNYKYPNDEIGELAGTFTHMAENLKRIIEDLGFMLSVMSEGDFTVESTCAGNYVGDMRSALDSMNTIKSTLGRTLKYISISAGKVSDNSSQISDGSQALAQGATEQAGSVEELSSTISSVNDKVQYNAENAEKASKIAMRTKDAITESNQEMHKLTTSMDEIEEASNKIQDVISIIDNIAFQTNILSLNAAIEAARAGQAGKGFAVVADEVGNLAKKSQEAAKDTAALIEQTIEAVQKGGEISAQTSESINSVSHGAKQITEIVSKISAASVEEAEGIQSLTQGIDQISSVVQTNAATAQESAASSDEMTKLAKTLSNEVGRFQLK